MALATMIEAAMPDEAASYFGEGTAGSVWKSMLAEQIAEQMAKAGGIGIAAQLARSAQAEFSAESAVGRHRRRGEDDARRQRRARLPQHAWRGRNRQRRGHETLKGDAMNKTPSSRPFMPPPVSPETRLGDYLPASNAARAREDVAARGAGDRPCHRRRVRPAGRDHRPRERTRSNRTTGPRLHRHQPAQEPGLLELTRLARALPARKRRRARRAARALREKLAHNQRTLGLHVNAVREIADLMVSVLGEAESDGTYGMVQPRRAGGR